MIEKKSYPDPPTEYLIKRLLWPKFHENNHVDIISFCYNVTIVVYLFITKIHNI